MFTGIIESTGIIARVAPNRANLDFYVQSGLAPELQPDQSVAHNGVCLTVTSVDEKGYTVTAIQETLSKTNLKYWKAGTVVNLERALKADSRLDGHFVQGHVDTVARCTEISPAAGSWIFRFVYPAQFAGLVIEKGSICINGISLTCFDVQKDSFCVAVIPYTMEHTNMHALSVQDTVNLEFDLLGKYVLRHLQLERSDLSAKENG